MSDFYLNARVYGNNILYTGLRNEKKIRQRIPYKPSLFVPTNENSPYKTLYGESLQKKTFDDIKSARDFVRQYEGVDNFKIYGNTKFEICLISDLFKDKIEWDISKIRIAIFDIETSSDPATGGFAKPDDPFQPIISIALKFLGEDKSYLFGFEDFNAPDDVIYIKCKDEWTLLKKFIEVWSHNYPDIVSGWFSNMYDIPYLVGRCNKILGTDETKKLSPWNVVREKKSKKFNEKFNRYEEEFTYSILGCSSLDYVDLYKKYYPDGDRRERDSLDFICELEIGETKVEYDGSLHKLYVEDINKFYLYNVHDVRLVELLDKKCKLFELGLALAYDSKVNYEDIFNQTRMGDSLCYDALKKQNIQVPNFNDNPVVDYPGGFVKSPLAGMHKWPVSVDATSLYPSIINGFNISPETLVDPSDYTPEMRNIVSMGVSPEVLMGEKLDLSFLKEQNVCLAANGQFFRTDKRGFVADLVEQLFTERKEYKNLMLRYEDEYEQLIKIDPKSSRLNELINLISKYNSLQTAKKLVANSIYGALGQKFFRFYDVRLAGAVTLTGQMTNQWTGKEINAYFNRLLKTNNDHVIYQDTDSSFLSFDGIVNKFLPKNISTEKTVGLLQKIVTDKIQPEIDNICGHINNYINIYKPTISYKLEKICSIGVFVAKKRYAVMVYSNEGVVYAEPQIKVTGLQIVQKSTPAIVRKALKKCLSYIMNNQKEELVDYVNDYFHEYKKYDVNTIAISRSVNGIVKYSDDVKLYKKGTPINTRGCILYNTLLLQKGLNKIYEEIKDGDKIKYCYLRLPNPLREDVIAFPEKLPQELDIIDYVDYNMMFEKTFMQPLTAITDLIGWRVEDEHSIEDFLE